MTSKQALVIIVFRSNEGGSTSVINEASFGNPIINVKCTARSNIDKRGFPITDFVVGSNSPQILVFKMYAMSIL